MPIGIVAASEASGALVGSRHFKVYRDAGMIEVVKESTNYALSETSRLAMWATGVRAAIAEVNHGDGVVILTDYVGEQYTIRAKKIAEAWTGGEVRVISGANLAAVYCLVTAPCFSDESFQEAVAEAVSSGQMHLKITAPRQDKQDPRAAIGDRAPDRAALAPGIR